jgi:hypothetical protein
MALGGGAATDAAGDLREAGLPAAWSHSRRALTVLQYLNG